MSTFIYDCSKFVLFPFYFVLAIKFLMVKKLTLALSLKLGLTIWIPPYRLLTYMPHWNLSSHLGAMTKMTKEFVTRLDVKVSHLNTHSQVAHLYAIMKLKVITLWSRWLGFWHQAWKEFGTRLEVRVSYLNTHSQVAHLWAIMKLIRSLSLWQHSSQKLLVWYHNKILTNQSMAILCYVVLYLQAACKDIFSHVNRNLLPSSSACFLVFCFVLFFSFSFFFFFFEYLFFVFSPEHAQKIGLAFYFPFFFFFTPVTWCICCRFEHRWWLMCNYIEKTK